jgi:hypothetical protein
MVPVGSGIGRNALNCLRRPRNRTHEKGIDRFVAHKLARRLENGERTVCEELPVLSGPDDRGPF